MDVGSKPLTSGWAFRSRPFLPFLRKTLWFGWGFLLWFWKSWYRRSILRSIELTRKSGRGEAIWLWCWKIDEREKKRRCEAMGDGAVFIGRDWGRVASHESRKTRSGSDTRINSLATKGAPKQTGIDLAREAAPGLGTPDHPERARLSHKCEAGWFWDGQPTEWRGEVTALQQRNPHGRTGCSVQQKKQDTVQRSQNSQPHAFLWSPWLLMWFELVSL